MAPWFGWLEKSWLGTSVNASTWAFAAIEAGQPALLEFITEQETEFSRG